MDTAKKSFASIDHLCGGYGSKEEPDFIHSLMLCVESMESHHRLFSANLLIQLDVLVSSNWQNLP